MNFQWQGPFQYYRCSRLCPECSAVLVSSTRLNWAFLKPLYHDMGMTCHCTTCNVKYRAFGRISFRKIVVHVGVLLFVILGLAMGFLFSLGDSKILHGTVVGGGFLLLLCMPKFVFHASEMLWWQKAKLERIFAYETLDNCQKIQ